MVKKCMDSLEHEGIWAGPLPWDLEDVFGVGVDELNIDMAYDPSEQESKYIGKSGFGYLLQDGEYLAEIGRLAANKKKGPHGKYVEVRIPFLIQLPDVDGPVEVYHWTSNKLYPQGGVYPIIKELLRDPPSANYPLRKLEGKKVYITVDVVTNYDKSALLNKIIKIRRAE